MNKLNKESAMLDRKLGHSFEDNGLKQGAMDKFILVRKQNHPELCFNLDAS